MKQANVEHMVKLNVSKNQTVGVPLSIVEEEMMEIGFDSVADYVDSASYYEAQQLVLRYRDDQLTESQKRSFVNEWVTDDIDMLLSDGDETLDYETFRSLMLHAHTYNTKSAIIRDFGDKYDHIIGNGGN